MKKINKKIIVSFFLLVLLALLSINYLREENVLVQTDVVSLRDISQSVSYAGSIESATQVKIASEIAGRVSAVTFEELDEVSQGQVLLKLDDAAIKARLNQAKEALNQAEINLVNAKITLNRVEKLFEKGFASREQLDVAQQAYDVSRALVKQSQSNYEVIRVRLEYTSIRAPVSGTVVSKNVAVGEIVAGPLGGGGLAMPSPIAEIADLNNLLVDVDVDELDIGKIKVGQKASISVDAYPDKMFNGVVDEIASATTGRREVGITYRVKVNIEGHEKMLKLGMTANVDFVISSRKQVLTVPRIAILVQGSKKFVFTVSDQKLHRREIMTDLESEDFMEVTSGLASGEKVVTGIKTGSGEGGGMLQFGQDLIPDDILELKDGQSVIILP
jgi:HlyD family secretion protein